MVLRIFVFFEEPVRLKALTTENNWQWISLKGSFKKNWHLRKDEGALNGLLSPFTSLKFNRKKTLFKCKKIVTRHYCPPLPSRFVILSKKLKRRIQTQPPPPFLHDVTLFAVFFYWRRPLHNREVKCVGMFEVLSWSYVFFFSDYKPQSLVS